MCITPDSSTPERHLQTPIMHCDFEASSEILFGEGASSSEDLLVRVVFLKLSPHIGSRSGGSRSSSSTSSSSSSISCSASFFTFAKYFTAFHSNYKHIQKSKYSQAIFTFAYSFTRLLIQVSLLFSSSSFCPRASIFSSNSSRPATRKPLVCPKWIAEQ